jgi:hypothetical protein
VTVGDTPALPVPLFLSLLPGPLAVASRVRERGLEHLCALQAVDAVVLARQDDVPPRSPSRCRTKAVMEMVMGDPSYTLMILGCAGRKVMVEVESCTRIGRVMLVIWEKVEERRKLYAELAS